MGTQTLSPPLSLPAGEVIAVDVAADVYLAQYAQHHHEWVKGVVLRMSPESLRHALLTKYFLELLDAYFSLRPIGRALDEPFVMRLESPTLSASPT